MTIALGLAAKHRAREQRLAPQGYEALRIKVFGYSVQRRMASLGPFALMLAGRSMFDRRNDLTADDVVGPAGPDPALPVIPRREHHCEIELGHHDQKLAAIPARPVVAVGLLSPSTPKKMPGVAVAPPI